MKLLWNNLGTAGGAKDGVRGAFGGTSEGRGLPFWIGKFAGAAKLKHAFEWSEGHGEEAKETAGIESDGHVHAFGFHVDPSFAGEVDTR